MTLTASIPYTILLFWAPKKKPGTMLNARTKPKISLKIYAKSQTEHHVASSSLAYNVKKYGTIVDGWACAARVKTIGEDAERFSQFENDCLHPIHDDTFRHCSLDVSMRIKQCFRDIVGRIRFPCTFSKEKPGPATARNITKIGLVRLSLTDKPENMTAP